MLRFCDTFLSITVQFQQFVRCVLSRAYSQCRFMSASTFITHSSPFRPWAKRCTSIRQTHCSLQTGTLFSNTVLTDWWLVSSVSHQNSWLGEKCITFVLFCTQNKHNLIWSCVTRVKFVLPRNGKAVHLMRMNTILESNLAILKYMIMAWFFKVRKKTKDYNCHMTGFPNFSWSASWWNRNYHDVLSLLWIMTYVMMLA